jgi:ferritin
MLSKKMQQKLNEQIRNEFHAAYLYLSMAAWFEASNLPGFSGWMRAQAGEERIHAMRLFDHLLDRNATVKLQSIPEPPGSWKSPLAVFEQALEHERKVTASINELYATAMQEQDFASRVFLDWFVNEQVEEEKNAQLIVEQLRMVGTDRAGLLMLDREYGARRPEPAEPAE